MEPKICVTCGLTFQPHHKVPSQTYCSSPACQKARRQDWLRAKQQNDPDYRDNQRRVQQAWTERNPDYWRNYRHSNAKSKGDDRNKPPLVKMNELTGLSLIPAGVYRIRPFARGNDLKNGTWLVEITQVCDACSCQENDCQDSTCWKFCGTSGNVLLK